MIKLRTYLVTGGQDQTTSMFGSGVGGGGLELDGDRRMDRRRAARKV